jgi:hypothetical protein
MPFDGFQFPPNIALEKLDRVIELLSDENRWCKGIVRSSDGRRCIIGALIEVDARNLLEPLIRDAVKEATGQTHWRLERFNDAEATTHAQVLAVLQRARADILAGRTVSYTLPKRLEEVCKHALSRLRLW